MGTRGTKKGSGIGEHVDDGVEFDAKGKGKIKTGPRSLENDMRLKQGRGKTCDCGAQYEGSGCPMC